MRRNLATVFSLFAAGVFFYTAFFVYEAYFGVPEGLTGGRTAVALPEGGRATARGGMIRRVEGMKLELRALAPNSVWEFENGGKAADFALTLLNVNPSAVRLQLYQPDAPEAPEPVPFDVTGPNVISFNLEIPPGSARTLQIEHVPGTEGRLRFFVFGHARNGERSLKQMTTIVNEEQPDFVVGLGDNYYRAFPDKILDFDRQLARMEVPTFIIPGELEYREQDEPSPADDHPLAGFHKLHRHAAIFGRGDQVFDFGGWRFVLVENGRDRNIGSLRWLKRLASLESAVPRTLLFSHIPPYDPRDIDGKDITQGSPKEHEVIIEQMKRLNVAATFFDHYRWFEAGEFDGVPIYITSISLTRRSKGQFPHFLDVRLAEGNVQVIRRSFTEDPPEDVTLHPAEAASPISTAEDAP